MQPIKPQTAKPAERHKKITILGDGLAKQSESKQCKFQLESASSTDLQQSGSTGQCSLTALE